LLMVSRWLTLIFLHPGLMVLVYKEVDWMVYINLIARAVRGPDLRYVEGRQPRETWRSLR
jgi:hypothetical protein